MAPRSLLDRLAAQQPPAVLTGFPLPSLCSTGKQEGPEWTREFISNQIQMTIQPMPRKAQGQ